MKVFLLKDIQNIGMAGEMVEVAEGYAQNFLIPQKAAMQVTKANEALCKSKVRDIEHRKEVIASKTSMLAERIKSTVVTVKRKVHDDGKLYGSVSPAEVVELLARQGVAVSKNQVIFEKAVKEKGQFDVTIKLSTTLQPRMKLKVVSE